MPRRKPVSVPAGALAWAAEAIGAGARVVRVQRLAGGIDSVVHGIAVMDARGARHEVVLRRRVGKNASVAAQRIMREATILRALAATSISAPRLLGVDPRGAASGGTPSLLMTRVPGHLHLSPTDPERWLRELAHALASIHAIALEAPPFEPWFVEKRLAVPDWSSTPALWQRAIALAVGVRTSFAARLVHGDFQHFNVLWRRDRVSGVVDWTDAGIGPAETDVAHCCLNLAVLFDVQWAERFRSAYAAEAGYPLEVWWEVAALMRYLPGWDGFVQVQAGRRAVVDLSGMHARVEALLAQSLSRL